MKLFKIFFIVCLSYISFNVFAEGADHVLPVFVNKWYVSTSVDPTKQVDACMQIPEVYNGVYNDKNALINTELDQVPAHPASVCIWGEKHYIGNETEKWPGFIGNDDDFNIIVKQYKADIWERDCLDNNSNLVDSKNVTAHPMFVCPAGSQYGETSDGVMGCTKQAFCLADVLARNIDIIAIDAHVGMVSNFGKLTESGNVLEVLNDKQVIHYNDTTITSSFLEHPSTYGGYNKYWGDRYGLVPNLNMMEAIGIIGIGATQSVFKNPGPEYTYTAKDGPYGHPGSYLIHKVYNQVSQQWDSQLSDDPPVFRCDTFVNYCYHTETGVELPNPASRPILPSGTYSSFPSLRNGTELAVLYPDISHIKLIHTWFTDENIITQQLNQQRMNLAVLDPAFSHYLQNRQQSRTTKLNFIWGIAQQYANNSIKFNYIMDYMSALTPIELAPQLIDYYRHTTSVSIKSKLIDILYRSMSSSDNNIDLLKSNTNNVILIQNFFTSLIKNEKNDQLLKRAIQYYPAVVPEDQAYTLISETLSQYKNNDHALLLKQDNYYAQQLFMAFSTNEAKKTLLPKLIHMVKKQNATNRESFNNKLFFLINYLDNHLELNINNDERELLMHYIKEQEPSINPQATSIITFNQAKGYYVWLSTLAILSSSSKKMANIFIASKIKQVKNPVLLGDILLLTNHDIISILSSSNDNSFMQGSYELRKLRVENYKDKLFPQVGYYRLLQKIADLKNMM